MGLLSKKEKDGEKLEGITLELKAKLDELAEKGNQFEEEEQYEEAIQAWEEGLHLIPEPQQYYSETIWFLAAIGDVYFMKGMYPQAHECFDKARGNLSGDGYGNPFIMLRLGECCFEIGDEKNAIEYLLRAYMMEGKEIFEPDEDGEDDGEKYFDFLRAHVEHIE
ncbi:MAG: tetratricopeptide repeat protein [Lachnospiraceae bacterium]|nr:tetratricopeptide repeat protein [Lachnospiraceae bacterium]